MDIISNIGNTISLATRLKEISNNIAEAEFQDVLADLSKQLSSLKLEASSLEEQLLNLRKENKALRNKAIDESEKLSQLKGVEKYAPERQFHSLVMLN